MRTDDAIRINPDGMSRWCYLGLSAASLLNFKVTAASCLYMQGAYDVKREEHNQ